MPRKISGFDLFFFDDSPSGECRPPESFEVQSFRAELRDWSPITLTKVVPERPRPGENRVRFDPWSRPGFASSSGMRASAFTPGLYGVRADPRSRPGSRGPETSPLQDHRR